MLFHLLLLKPKSQPQFAPATLMFTLPRAFVKAALRCCPRLLKMTVAVSLPQAGLNLYPRADSLLIPSPPADSGSLFEAMSSEYGIREWEEWAASARPLRGGRGWLQPTLTRLK
jgi:hypothetical protein